MNSLLNLQHLLQHQIEDLYSAEEQIIEAMPKMVQNVSNPELRKGLNQHLQVTKDQKRRLGKIQQLLKKENGQENMQQKSFLERMFGGGTKCKGMQGLITEGEKMMGEEMEPAVMDAAIIAAAQKIEHYEISGYGTARAYARQLGLTEVIRLLETTLNEEYKADDQLTALALKKINIKAEKGPDAPGKSAGRNGSRANGTGNKSGQKTTSKKSIPKKATSKTAKR